MERSARSVRVITIVGLFNAAALVGVSACSSAPVADDDAGTTTAVVPPPLPPVYEAGPYDSGATSMDVGILPPPPPPPSDGGLDTSPGPIPPQCAFNETEANDTEQTANAFPVATNPHSTTACGSASATDSDYLSFTLPVGTQNYNLNWTGAISWTLSVNGTTITYPGASALPPVDTAHPYVMKVIAAQSAPWTVTVISQ